MNGPIVIGGNGHSGTRVFCDIVTLGGVATGRAPLTKRRESADLRIIDLLNRWVEPSLRDQLSDHDRRRMQRAFRWRLRCYFPMRSNCWGFKNPRTMLILPFLDELLRDMKFIHVIRDGRDIALGNPFVNNNRYVPIFLSPSELQLSPEEKMILFWGRSNQFAADYGLRAMENRYLQVRWEDLCHHPIEMTTVILEFAGCPKGSAGEIARIVKQPSSLGRWRTFPEQKRAAVEALGSEWLERFGYR